jgi:translation elongation factor EF-1beta
MSDVAITVQVLPESVEAFGEMKEAVIAEAKPKQHREADIAFGLKALVLTIIASDEKGSEGLEERLKSIKGVGEVQVLEVTRV